jgi:predicted short-subunit dehydrogenase-like oxidoreductase (DUF2520 family)
MSLQHNKSYSYGIIGAGKVGLSLAIALEKRNQLDWIVARSVQSQANAIHFLNDPNKILSTFEYIKELPDYILIAVDNKNIQFISDLLALTYGSALNYKNIVHFSGSLNRDILKACEDQGAFTFASHPYQTFFSPDGSLFDNIPWGIEPSNEIERIINFVEDLNGNPIVLSEQTVKNKPVYHLSAVAVSNFFNTILGFAKEMAIESDINPIDFFSEIIKTTLKNNLAREQNDTFFPLTGPVARRDLEAIKKHIELLDFEPRLKEIYKLMTKATIQFALLKEINNENEFQAIFDFLN